MPMTEPLPVEGSTAWYPWATEIHANVNNIEKQAEFWTYAVGDDITAITVGTNKGEFYMPFAFTMSSYRLTVRTGGTVQATIVDINKNGVTTMTTNKLSIDVSEKTSTTAATAAVLTTATWALDDIVTIDFDQVGTGAAGVQITFYGTRI